MSKIIVSLMIVTCSIYLTGCNGNVTEVTVDSKNPDAAEVLRLDKSADIFQWEGLIYQTKIDWVDETEVTKKELVGEIVEISSSNKHFNDGMANKLPIGAKVYSTKERGDILIVEYDGKRKKYLGLGEG